MKKIIKLTESDIVRIAKRVISERENLDDPHFRLFVPKEYENAVIELGPHPTPGVVIDVFNDIFQGNAPELVDFNEDLFLFYNQNGDELTPEEIFEEINDYLMGENEDYF